MAPHELRRISAAETHELRGSILRPNRPLADCIYPGDEAPRTAHFGAFSAGRLVGIASLYEESPPAACAGRAWRLRGMAVSVPERRAGHGTALLAECVRWARQSGGETLWCNARVNAAPFYRRSGFVIAGESFEVPGIGLHFFMQKELGPVRGTG